jgi:hypothetical protein
MDPTKYFIAVEIECGLPVYIYRECASAADLAPPPSDRL